MKDSVNVMGTIYAIETGNDDTDPALKEIDGYVDSSIKKIVIHDFVHKDGDDESIVRFSKKDLEAVKKRVLRHEILHAFLYESGLDTCGYIGSDEAYSWPLNEEMVDWFALQSPKIFAAYNEVGCL